MEIFDKTNDPVAAQYHMADAAFRWALQAAEEIVGKPGLGIVLRNAGLERFIDNYPPEEFVINKVISNGEYANFNASLISFFGRASKSMSIRIGRQWSHQAIAKQSAAMGLAAVFAARLLPVPSQIKMLMENMQGTFRRQAEAVGGEFHSSVEVRETTIAYIANDCPMCAGKQASDHICWSWVGTLQEALSWMTGKEFDIVEVACRATGAPACIWEVQKTPRAT